MYYLIDYDSLDIVCQHTSKKVLTAYIEANDLSVATEIVGTAKDVTEYLTKQEMMEMYENITLNGLAATHSESAIGEMLLIAITEQTYPEPPTATDKEPKATDKPVKQPKKQPSTRNEEPVKVRKTKPSMLAGLNFTNTDRKTKEGSVFGVIADAISDHGDEATFEQIHEYFMDNYVAAKTGNPPTDKFTSGVIRDAANGGVISEVVEEDL